MLPASKRRNATSNVSKLVIAHYGNRDVGVATRSARTASSTDKKKTARDGGVSQ